MKRFLAILLTALMVLALMPVTAKAEGDSSYTMTLELSKTSDYYVGDTVTLTAHVFKDGTEITDLEAEGLYVYFWKDTWEGEYQSEGYDLANDDNSGWSLTASVTFTAAGEYNVGYNLQDSSWNTLLGNYYQAFSVSKKANDVQPVTAAIDVERVTTLEDYFIMGMDISSAPSLINAGVTFKDWDGNVLAGTDTQEKLNSFVQFLADNGITHVRVRVWNDPFDEDGHGYGGGNCDVNNAVMIANACAAAGVYMLIDFHYSDFWADPGRQTAPKAWTELSTSEKATAMRKFTKESLKTISAAGAEIEMVQIGNEITSGMAGISSSDLSGMCTLFSAGAVGVHEVLPYAKIVIHVTNPEIYNMTSWADALRDFDVHYEILATSYYPYWHGTLDNLKSQMQTVIEEYGKDVMIAETSYTYTLEDTDGHENTIKNEAAKGENASYPSTVQGQATAIREVINAVSEVGGLGVYYWEPAWITVGDITGLEGDDLTEALAANKSKWETYGCGWASTYAADYDANVGENGIWAGGSPVDNEAMFGADGSPLESLHVWEYVKTGAENSSLTAESIENPEVTLDYVGTVEDAENAELKAAVIAALPGTVNVTYSKTNVGTIAEPVTWSEDDIASVLYPGTYTITGSAALSQTCTDGTTAVDTECILTVREANILTDAHNYEFESDDGFTVTGSGVTLSSTQDVLSGSRSLHWYNESAVTDTITADEIVTLDWGWYTLEITAMGYAGDTVTLNILDSDGNVLQAGEPVTLEGWTSDPSEFQTGDVTFFLNDYTDIKLQVVLDVQDGGWGSVDSLYLHGHDVDSTSVSNDDGTITYTFTCLDCGRVLGTETMEPEKPEFKTCSVLLSEGQVGLNFYMYLPYLENVDYDESKMVFTVQGETEEDTYDSICMDSNGNGWYGFTCHLTSIQMAEPVTAVFTYGDGETVETTYSVQQYIETFEENRADYDADVIGVVEALADYGHYVQIFLSGLRGWTLGEGMDYEEMTTYFTDSYTVDDVKSAVADYGVSCESVASDIASMSYSLVLDSDIGLNVYFKPTDTYSGVPGVVADNQDVEPEAVSGGRYRVSISGIYAQNLDDPHTVYIYTDGVTEILDLSPLAYINTALNKAGVSEDEVKALSSLYYYYNAVQTYLSNHLVY